MGYERNVAGQKWRVFAFDAAGVPVTGDAANITAKVAKDWGTATALGDTNPVEVEDGYYLFDLTQAETNAATLDLYPQSATGSVQVIGVPGTKTAISALVWDRIISMSNHNIGQSAGKVLRQSGEWIQIAGAVSDAGPAATGFDTDLAEVDGYFEDALLVFVNGAANAGIGRPIVSYLNTNGAVTFQSPDEWPVTPVNGDDFVIVANHIHPVSQIAAAVMAGGDIDGNSLEQSQRIIQAAAGGKLSGAEPASPTVVIRAADDSKPRITASTDEHGNRTSVTLDASG